jgi:hypothetical protein
MPFVVKQIMMMISMMSMMMLWKRADDHNEGRNHAWQKMFATLLCSEVKMETRLDFFFAGRKQPCIGLRGAPPQQRRSLPALPRAEQLRGLRGASEQAALVCSLSSFLYFLEIKKYSFTLFLFLYSISG